MASGTQEQVEESSHGISRRAFIRRLGGAGAALLGGAAQYGGPASPKRPNILWIMTDEHRWDAIRAYGRKAGPSASLRTPPGGPNSTDRVLGDWVRSPNLDALAAEGVLFREAYCQAPLCVGSRVSILTGRYPHHTGVYGFEYSHPDTPFSVPFFTDLMHQSGYEVVSFGKEHHYRLASKSQPYTRDGKWYNVVNPFADKDFHSWGKANIQEATPSALLKGAEREAELGILRRYLTEKKLIIGGTNPVSADQTLSAHLSNMAIRHLQSDASRDRPLFLRVSYIYPHTPVLPPVPFNMMYNPASIPLPQHRKASCGVTQTEIDSFGRQTRTAYENLRVHGMKEDEIRKLRADYYGLASYADSEIGRVIRAFKAFSAERPWLIVFNPDHGCKLGEHGMQEKFTFYDESVHVPLIAASSDERLPRGRVCDDFVELVDLAPTFLGAAGVRLPEHLEGRDLADTAHGRLEARSEAISEKLTYGRRAMLRTKRWSFEMQVSPDPQAGRRLKNEEMTWAAKSPLSDLDISLFDRENDPAERHNLGPDPKYRKLCEELRERLVARIFPPDRVEYDWSKDIPRKPKA